MIAAIPAALIELGFSEFLFSWLGKSIFTTIFYIFIGIALVEEVLKYLVVRGKVLNDPEFDEPVDAMLYMIIAALGFVALENLLIFLSPKVFLLPIGETITLAGFRFISATFLHALCSGMVGFFLALSFFETKKRNIYLASGLTLAIILHGLYNFYIIKIEESLSFIIIPIIILIGLAIFVSLGFKKLKKLESVCKIS